MGGMVGLQAIVQLHLNSRSLKRCSRLTTVKEYAELGSAYERDEKRVQDLEEKAQESKDAARRAVPMAFAIGVAIAVTKLTVGAM